jgi:FKBP-type peptidyl-prolyl cis-trans isomerase FkpA
VFPRSILFALLTAALTFAQNRPATQPAQEKQSNTMTDEQKIIYAIGLSISRSLTPLDLSPAELDVLKQALSDGASGKPAIDLQEWGPRIKELSNARGARALEKQKSAGKAYLDKMAAEPGASKTESGLVYKIVTPGEGTSPTATDTVKVNYRGTLVDGTEFDSSYKRNEPATFTLNGVVPCWTEGLQKMKPGGKAILACPSDLAYGDGGRPSIPGGAALIFEIELLEVNPGAQPPTPGTPAAGQTTPPGQAAPSPQ